MKILFVLGYPNPFSGAAWTRIGFFANAWSKFGLRVDVLGTFTPATLQKNGAAKLKKVNIFNLIFNVNLANPFIFSVNNLLSFFSSSFFLLAERPDVTIISVPSGGVEFGAVLACKLNRRKYVIDYRDEWEDYVINLIENKTEKAFYSFVKKLATILYAQSRLVSTVTSNCSVSLKRRGLINVTVIPNGADAKTFQPVCSKWAKHKAFKLIYSGGVGNYYRLDVVLRAMKILLARGLGNITLVIVGEGAMEEIFDLAFSLGISQCIDYQGVIVEKENLAAILADADVGLIPYDANPLWKNSLPAKFFEYCSCGTPVIATVYEDSLMAQLINSRGIGLTSTPLDEQRLADAIYRIYNDRQFRFDCGRNARILVEQEFDRNKIANDYMELVKTCYH